VLGGKVQRAKDIVANTKQHEENELPLTAEGEIKKLIPFLS